MVAVFTLIPFSIMNYFNMYCQILFQFCYKLTLLTRKCVLSVSMYYLFMDS